MQLIYPAVFHKCEDDTYEGYFPDLEGCVARGETIDECTNDAIEAGLTWIQVELEEEGVGLPPVSDAGDLELKEGEFLRNIAITLRLLDGFDE